MNQNANRAGRAVLLWFPRNRVAEAFVGSPLITPVKTKRPLQFSSQQLELHQRDPSLMGTVKELEPLNRGLSEFFQGDGAVEVRVGSRNRLRQVEQPITGAALESAVQP